MVASKIFETIAHNIWGALSPNPAQEHVFSLHNNYVFNLYITEVITMHFQHTDTETVTR